MKFQQIIDFSLRETFNFPPCLEFWHMEHCNFLVLVNGFRLSEKLKQQEHSKDDVVKGIQSKKEYLDSLQPKLNAILEVGEIILA